MKTQFHFQSTAFNCTEPKDHFINPGCFGDDVAKWLGGRLRKQGFRTSDPEQEDFGWYFTFWIGDVEHCIVIGFQPNDTSIGDQWIGWIERQRGFFGSLFGGRHRGILPEAIQAVDKVLRSAPEIRQLSWHEQGDPEQ